MDKILNRTTIKNYSLEIINYNDDGLTSTGFVPSEHIRLAVDIIFQFDALIRISSFLIH